MEISLPRNQRTGSPHPGKQLPIRTIALLVIGSLVIAALGFILFTPLQKAEAATWTQIWSDEFNGVTNTGVNSANWLYDLGTGYGCNGCPSNWGTGEIEVMTNSTANVYHNGQGQLAIKAIRDASGGWTSGRIETQRTNFNAPAGGLMAVEASIRLPNVTGNAAPGYWPAFWMLGSPFRGNYLNWPSVGEIDIMENVNGLNQTWGVFHCGSNPGGPCNESTGIGNSRVCSGTTCQAAFHTYRVEVDKSVSPQQIRWYQDGVNFHTVSANQVDATTWNNATNHSWFIILNLAMGGGFPAAFGGGPTATTASGAAMLVDYVRVFTSPGNGTNPTPGNTPGTTPTTGPCPSNGFTYGIDNTGATSARSWFKPCGWTASYVILHYVRPGLDQQNVYMTYNSSTARWELNVSNISSGQQLRYQFTYNRDGLQHDTDWYNWTHP